MPTPTPLQQVFERHGLTQLGVARDLGISQGYLSELCTGSRVPSIPMAMNLLSFLRQRTGEEITFELLFGTPALPAAANE